MKTSKKAIITALVAIIGIGGAAATAMAQGDNLVTICFSNRTISVPSYLVSRYISSPLFVRTGPCGVTPR